MVKKDKKIQDAHEAIRPTDITRTPVQVKESLTRDQFRLYQLIWKRFVASRMHQQNMKYISKDQCRRVSFYGCRFQGCVSDGFMSVYNSRMMIIKKAMYCA